MVCYPNAPPPAINITVTIDPPLHYMKLPCSIFEMPLPIMIKLPCPFLPLLNLQIFNFFSDVLRQEIHSVTLHMSSA